MTPLIPNVKFYKDLNTIIETFKGGIVLFSGKKNGQDFVYKLICGYDNKTKNYFIAGDGKNKDTNKDIFLGNVATIMKKFGFCSADYSESKYASKLESFSTEQLNVAVSKIDKLIKVYKTDPKKTKVILQLEALKDVITEIIDNRETSSEIDALLNSIK